MIRDFEARDLRKVKDLMVENDLPPGCMPDLIVENQIGQKKKNPLFVVKRVFEHDGATAMICFLKVRSELYFFIDHKVGTPEQRRDWLTEFTEDICREAARQGLDQISCFVPPEIDKYFSKRLIELGFRKSPWISYSLNLE
jgi:hypothetical protein